MTPYQSAYSPRAPFPSLLPTPQGYKELYAKKWSFTKELAYQIEGGLQKMFEAKADVNKMKAELAVKNQDLAVSAKEAEALLKQISESTAIAEKEKQKVAVIVDAVTKKASEIATVKDDAERDLAAAKPALDAALEALNSIKDGDIKNLKALKKPPQIITRIFDCVLVLRMLVSAVPAVSGLQGGGPGQQCGAGR